MNKRNNIINLLEHPEFKFACKFDDVDWEILREFRGRGFGLTAHEVENYLGKYTYAKVYGQLVQMEKDRLVNRLKKRLPKVPGKEHIYRRIEHAWLPTQRGEEYGRTWPRPSLGPQASNVKPSKARTGKGSGDRQPLWSHATVTLRAPVPRAGGKPPA